MSVTETTARLPRWFGAALLGSLAVRLSFVFLHRTDSDEPQHLHVAWAWSQGLMQYRDVFDNHFPLLHLLFAPLMAVMPESPAVFLAARLAIQPLALACSWLLYRLAVRIVDPPRAALAALLFMSMPPWLPKSVEFRNDTLWVFLWLSALLFVLKGRHCAAGLAAGLCVLASVKAMPLLLAHALALVPHRALLDRRVAGKFSCGFVVPLAALLLFLHAFDALKEMIDATLLFNVRLPVTPIRRWGGAAAFGVICLLAVRRGPGLLRTRAPFTRHLSLVAVWYVVLLLCFWPSISPRDFLPLVPLAALAIAVTMHGPARGAVALTATVLASIWYTSPWQAPDRARERFVAQVVALTTKDQFVFDLKGDGVFRRRPVYYIYDIVGRALTANGTISDDGPEQIVAKRSCVAVPDSSYVPRRTRLFLNAHFLDVGGVRVCGTHVRGDTFVIAVPQIYAVDAADAWQVVVDGEPYRGPRFLEAGRHSLGRPRDRDVRVLWWRAVAAAPPPHPAVIAQARNATRR